MSANLPHRVLLVGGSSGNHVLAADLGRQERFEVAVLSRRSKEWQSRITCTEERMLTDAVPFLVPSLRRRYTGELAQRYDWTRLQEALAWAETIILTCPVHAHRSLLEKILPALPPNRSQALGTLYAQGGFDWIVRDLASRQGGMPAGLTVFGLKRFPFLCKKTEYGRAVYLMGRFPKIIAAVDGPDTKSEQALLDRLKVIFGKPVERLPSFFPCVLTLSNQVLHPAINMGLFAGYQPGKTRYPVQKRFYGDCNATAAQYLDDLADEIRSLARRLETEVGFSLHRYLGSDPVFSLFLAWRDRHWHLVSKRPWAVRVRNQLMAFGFRSNKRLNRAPAPMKPVDDPSGGWEPDVTSRFWLDDLAHGLCVVLGLAELVEWPMPVTAKVVAEQQVWLGKEYVRRVNGDWRLEGRDVAETNAPQRYGISRIQELCTRPPRAPVLKPLSA